MFPFFFNKDASQLLEDPDLLEPSKQVFGNFLFHNELGILFGDTNSAKSILAVDIGLSFCAGISHWGQAMTDPSIGNGIVYYYDLEQSDRQFAHRYKNAPFPQGRFFRTQFSLTKYGAAGAEELIEDVKTKICDKKHIPVFLEIDNLQCTFAQTFSPTKVKYLMQQLKMLKELYQNLTILLIAHSTKRNMSKPLTQNSLAGSKVLANFADSIFGISNSAVGESCRYLTQLKSREVARMDEVAVCEISDQPYLHLDLVDFDMEENHLKKIGGPRTSKIDEAIREKIIAMNEKGASTREIESYLGISKSHVSRILRGES